MAFTQTDVNNLEAAIATGTKRVTIADQTREFHSFAEMRDLLAMMKRQVDSPRTHYLSAHSKATG